jgi:hypothetical protein
VNTRLSIFAKIGDFDLLAAIVVFAAEDSVAIRPKP